MHLCQYGKESASIFYRCIPPSCSYLCDCGSKRNQGNQPTAVTQWTTDTAGGRGSVGRILKGVKDTPLQ